MAGSIDIRTISCHASGEGILLKRNRPKGYPAGHGNCRRTLMAYFFAGLSNSQMPSIPIGKLGKGYIQPSQSPMASPFFFVDKKDGKLRPCQDYQYLHEHTVKNA